MSDDTKERRRRAAARLFSALQLVQSLNGVVSVTRTTHPRIGDIKPQDDRMIFKSSDDGFTEVAVLWPFGN